jgi:hypothetical protein
MSTSVSKLKSKIRPRGPGVLKRPAPAENDLVLTQEGLDRPNAAAASELRVAQPKFDPRLPVAHPGGQHCVTQLVVEDGRTVIHDVVVPVTQQMSAWQCYARSVRGSKWCGLAPVQWGGSFALRAGRIKLYVRRFEPSMRDSETGEITWRWTLENVSDGRGTDLLVRFVVKLRRWPLPR